MGEISMSGHSVVRTPMYALAKNRRFCPAAPMKKAPTTVLDSLHHCWGPNWHKTTVKKIQWCLMLGTLADDLSCPVQPPSLVLYKVCKIGNVQRSNKRKIPPHSTRRFHHRAQQSSCCCTSPGQGLQERLHYSTRTAQHFSQFKVQLRCSTLTRRSDHQVDGK